MYIKTLMSKYDDFHVQMLWLLCLLKWKEVDEDFYSRHKNIISLLKEFLEYCYREGYLALEKHKRKFS